MPNKQRVKGKSKKPASQSAFEAFISLPLFTVYFLLSAVLEYPARFSTLLP